MPRSPQGQPDPATLAWHEGMARVRQHPLFAPLAMRVHFGRDAHVDFPRDGWARVWEAGRMDFHPRRRGAPDEWAYVAAHGLLHLAFGHFRAERLHAWREWNAACDCFVARFLADLRFGRPPPEIVPAQQLSARTEDELFERFVEMGIPPELSRSGTAGDHAGDMVPASAREAKLRSVWGAYRTETWEALFARGLQEAVRGAVTVAAGRQASLLGQPAERTQAALAREWFIHSYPLLGGIAAAFKLVEDADVCRRLDVSIAAVDAGAGEIYINPHAGLDEQEMRFVMAHELLHAGLRHQARTRGRDPYLWNVACDFVINAWLVEMGVGRLPRMGVLLDPELKGLSAEQVYDRIARDLRTYRKLATLRGTGLGDMLGSGGWWERGDGVRLDELYRNALTQGLHYHAEGARGFLPADLVEEIRGLDMPPIPWEVELARWFDERFAPVEARRTYARMSRRQAATPHIPRPAWVLEPEELEQRTFGVVLDTSGSMDRQLLAKALGTIASYAIARDVPQVRLVFCDAAAYDAGYMAPEEMLGRVRVRGRGGTVLQPGVDLLEAAKDFPEDGPILLITDGWCDRVRVRREHAFVLPYGATLPFVPAGKVFRVR